MISKKRFSLVAAALAAVGLASSALVTWTMHDKGDMARAAWAFKAHTLGELSAHADAIVVAQAGGTYHSRFAYSDNGEDVLPFEVTEFQVVRAIRGGEAGSTVLVERAGGVDPAGILHTIDADGGPFEAGVTYLLFLEQQPDTDLYFQLNDQARYTVRGDRLEAVEPDSEDPVTAALHGQSVLAAIQRIERGQR